MNRRTKLKSLFFLISLLHQITKYNNFLLEYWFLGKNLSNIASLFFKLDNPNNSTVHISTQICHMNLTFYPSRIGFGVVIHFSKGPSLATNGENHQSIVMHSTFENRTTCIICLMYQRWYRFIKSLMGIRLKHHYSFPLFLCTTCYHHYLSFW